MSSTIREKFFSGVKANLIGQTLAQVFTIVATILVARRLQPVDFSVAAIVLAAANIFLIFFGRGFAMAIIPKQVEDRTLLHSVFTFYVVLALLASGLFYLISGLLASFYGSTAPLIAFRVLGLYILFSILGYLPRAIIEMKLEFKLLNVLLVSSAILGSATSVILALRGYGYWALLLPGLASAILEAVLFYALCGYRPALRFSFEGFRKFMRFGSISTLTDILHTTVTKGDYLIFGRVWTPFQLGNYFFAFEKASKPFDLVLSKFTSLLMPTLGAVKADEVKFRLAFQKITEVGMIIIFPMSIVLMALAGNFVPLFFGEQWRSSVLLFQIFVAGWYIRAFGMTVSPALYALDVTRYSLLNAVIRFSLSIPFFLICMSLRTGPVVVAIGILAISYICAGLYYWRGLHIVGISIRELVVVSRKPIVIALAMLALILAIKGLLIYRNFSPWMQFLVPFIAAGVFNLWAMRTEYRHLYLIFHGNEPVMRLPQ